MKAEIKYIHSPDILDLQNFQDDGSPFSILFQVMIGKKNDDAFESFSFEVCNIKHFQSLVKKDYAVFCHGFIVIDYYDYDQIVAKITKLIDGIDCSNWEIFASNLAKYSHYEFDGYSQHDCKSME